MALKHMLVFILVVSTVSKTKASDGSIYSGDDDYDEYDLNKLNIEDSNSLVLNEKDFTGKVECSYETSNSYEDYGEVYVCYLLNKLNIISKNAATLINSDGNHSVLKSDYDVTAFRSDEAHHIIHYFPRNMENIFPNLTIIFINNGRLKEVHQSNLKPFQKLTYLDLDQNDIEILEDGLFYYNTKLTFIRLEKNLIIRIGTNVFDNLSKLKSLCLHNNPCIHMEAKNNATEVMKIIKTAQLTCLNADYDIVDNNLKNIEDTLVCVNSETLSIFETKFQHLESKFKKSNFSLSKVLQKRFDAVNEFKFQTLWTTKDKLEKIGKSLLDSELEVINNIKIIKNELQIDNKRVENAIRDMIRSLERSVDSKTNYFINGVKNNIRNQSNVVTTKINDINSNIDHMHEINTNFTKESINILKNELTSKLSTINDRMLTIESSISHLSSIMQEYIDVNTRSSRQFQSELKDRLQVTNYKIDKNSMIQDYSKSILVGSCALLITLVLVILYKKILTRPDDMNY